MNGFIPPLPLPNKQTSLPPSALCFMFSHRHCIYTPTPPRSATTQQRGKNNSSTLPLVTTINYSMATNDHHHDDNNNNTQLTKPAFVFSPLSIKDIPQSVNLLNNYLSFGLSTPQRLMKFFEDPNAITVVVSLEKCPGGNGTNGHNDNDEVTVVGFAKCQFISNVYINTEEEKAVNLADGTRSIDRALLTGQLSELGYKSAAIEFIVDHSQKLNLFPCLSLDLIVVEPQYRNYGLFHHMGDWMKGYAKEWLVLSLNDKDEGIVINNAPLHVIGYSWVRSPSLSHSIQQSSLATQLIQNYWLDEQYLCCPLCPNEYCKCDVMVFIKG